MERDKKELQAWMKKKRKERLAEYLQARAEQREKEHHPFQLRRNMVGFVAPDCFIHITVIECRSFWRSGWIPFFSLSTALACL